MEVQLKPEQEAFLADRVRAGVYASTDEAVQAAIDLLESEEALDSSAELTGVALVAAMQSSPYKEIDIEPSRPFLPVRSVEF